MEVASNLLPNAERSDSGSAELAHSLKRLTHQAITNSIQNATSLLVLTANIVINLFPFDPRSPPSPSPEDDVQVSFPSSGLPSGCADTTLSKVLYKGALYEDLAPSHFSQASDTLSLDLYSCQKKQPVSRLEEDILLSFAVDPADFVTVRKIWEIGNGLAPREDLSCSFYDAKTKSVSSEGCRLLDVNATSITCACNHMTDFMVFVRTGAQVLQSANYNVFRAATRLSFSSLTANLGFIFFLLYWGLYLALLLTLALLTRRGRRKSFFSRLFASLRREEKLMKHVDRVEERLQRIESVLFSTDKAHHPPRPQPKTRNSSTYLSCEKSSEFAIHPLPLDKTPNSRRQDEESDNPPSDAPSNSFDALPNVPGTSFALKNAEEGLSRRYFSKSEVVRARLLSVIKSERRCCCACCRLFGDEIATHNQVYHLVRGSSFLASPEVRLSLLFLSLLFEFFLNALFFNLSPSREEPPLLWAGMMENFWVSVYSFAFAMLPLVGVGAIFSASSKAKKSLKRAQSPQDLKRVYGRLRKGLRCKMVGGMLFFALMSNFLLLYIVCFCEEASRRMA